MFQKAFQKFIHAMEPRVFLPSGALVIGFVFLGSVFTEQTRETFQWLQQMIVHYTGWLYILALSFFLVVTVFILFSPYGKIRLGRPDDRPEFSYFAWFTMLFSAGMGTGLVFWGVAEPLTHFVEPPAHKAVPENPWDLAVQSLFYTFFHWGFHPWGVYIIFGLGIAFYHFRHGMPLAPRTLLYPVLGDRIYGWVGHVVDTLATVGTLFGVATSLGLGAMQINAGVSHVSPIPNTTLVQISIVLIVTAVATISVVSGISHGIRRLSQLNIFLAAMLVLFVFLSGPTLRILELFVSTMGKYFSEIVATSLWINPDPDVTWQADWTLFYWGWWVSWSPFVGVFVARISKGRTVREFTASVLFIPTIATMFWLSVFGTTALDLHMEGVTALWKDVDKAAALSLHSMLEHLPIPTISSVLATLLVIIFFVTSSDSGSLVDDMVTSGGHPNPPKMQRVFWAVSEGSVAAVLLLAGGLRALRTASITSGLPMTIILIMASVGLVLALRRDYRTEGIASQKELKSKAKESSE